MSIPFLTHPPKIGCGDPGDPIDFSLRCDGDGWMYRDLLQDGNRQKWQISEWIKRSELSQWMALFYAYSGNSEDYIGFQNNNLFRRWMQGQGGNPSASSNLFRDPAAWGLFEIIFDSSQVTPEKRIEAYYNGDLLAKNTSYNPTLDHSSYLNSAANRFGIGRSTRSASHFFKGYRAWTHFFDGLNPGPLAIGYVNSDGHIVPKKYTGEFGEEGFLFEYKNPLNLGENTCGNGKHFTVEGLTPDNQSTDTPTNNQPVHHTFDNATQSWTITDGGLRVENDNFGSALYSVRSSFSLQSGKYWFGGVIESFGSAGNPFPAIGVADASRYFGNSVTGRPDVSYGRDGIIRDIAGAALQSGLPTYAVNDKIHIALDCDNHSVQFYKNGVMVGMSVSYNFDMVTPAIWSFYNARVLMDYDANPHGIAAPDGFGAISSKTLPCPDILNPDDYFTIRLKSNGDDVTDLPWNPQTVKTLVVSKRLDTSSNWRVVSTVSGASKWWSFNGTASEQTDNGVAFTASGISPSSHADYQGNRVEYFWRADRASGLDIIEVNHTNGVSSTVSHNCGGAIDYAWVFNATAGGDRRVFHKDMPAGQYLRLNSTAAASSDPGWFSSTANDLTLGASLPTGTYYLCLCRSVSGLSTFTKSQGNGSSDGQFIPMDFQPRLASIMRPGAASNHHISDADRSDNNPVKKYNNMESTSGEGSTTRDIDFDSNGLKVRVSTGDINANGADHLIAAWAKAPFKFARAQ